MRARILDPISRFVRKLAKVHFPGMRRRTQHVNVCAGTKDAILCAGEDDRANLRMLEPNSLQRIMQLNVHTKVVGIQLQLVPRPKPPVLAYVHEQGRYWTIRGKLPVPVTGRIGLVVYVVGLGLRVMTDCGIHEILLQKTISQNRLGRGLTSQTCTISHLHRAVKTMSGLPPVLPRQAIMSQDLSKHCVHINLRKSGDSRSPESACHSLRQDAVLCFRNLSSLC